MALIFSSKGSWSKASTAVPSGQSRRDSRERRGAPPPAATSGRATLGSILLERQVITEAQLNAAVEQQHRTGRRLGHVLIDMGATTHDAVLGALSKQLGVPGVRIKPGMVNMAALKALPEKVARRHRVFPMQRVGSALTVAVATPTDLETLDDLRFASEYDIRTVVALEDEIALALDTYYRPAGVPPQPDAPVERVIVEPPLAARRDDEAERSAVAIVDRLLARSAAEGASDLHLESTPDSFRVRFRVDGTFRNEAKLGPALAPAVIARVKVLSGMDIAEHRLPQDGRFTATVGMRRLDLRTSTYPTLHGEKAVLRLLDHSSLRLHLESLGMRGVVLDRFRDLIRRPEGMVLITGPTGSGKTSTLYAALTELVETGKHIITIEDPVEYALPGVNQGQTNDKAGFTFARGLRAILRQDPDVIMVGEIRDSETIQTAIEASLTGHLVFSTLHTNSALATAARMIDMGLEPYMLASSLLGIVAQRLVRCICPRCRTEVPTPSAVAHLFPGGAPARLYRGLGCKDCRGTGYRGRVAIHELVMMNEELRHLIMERAPEGRLLEAAQRAGTVTLREECLARVTQGETTLEEVVRLTQER